MLVNTDYHLFWERISSDFGSDSTFSSILFDNFMLTIGDTAIISANGVGVERIDLDIPDQVFVFQNANNGPERVQGIRNYQKEVVYWCYADSNTQAAPGVPTTFPNRILLYNYRNATWAIWRANVTSFGNYRLSDNITWDRLDIFWDDEEILWDDLDSQSQFPAIVSTNQQGFVHVWDQVDFDEPSLAITFIDLSVTPIVVEIPNHNLSDGEIISINGMLFRDKNTLAPITTSLNGVLYRVSMVDQNNISLSLWNYETQAYYNNFTFTPSYTVAEYIGGGLVTLFPQMMVQTKDINVFQPQGLQTKLSYIDFLLEPQESPGSTFAINLFVNSSPAITGELNVWRPSLSQNLDQAFNTQTADYSWFRFFATLSCQYFNIQMTYDDNQMNDVNTHHNGWTMYAIQAWMRPGGRTTFTG